MCGSVLIVLRLRLRDLDRLRVGRESWERERRGEERKRGGEGGRVTVPTLQVE